MNQDTQLKDFIKKFKLIKQSDLTWLSSQMNSLEFVPHVWTSYDKILHPNADTEFKRAATNFKIDLILNQYVNRALEMYADTFYDKKYSINGLDGISINRYDTGTEMLEHVDHIHGIFSGHKKGIPILSIVGLLNNDFEGGKFVFWKDHYIDLQAGDILVFPSVFLYQHRVELITSGTRFSFVTWAF